MFFICCIGHIIYIYYRKWFSPIALAAEARIAQAVVGAAFSGLYGYQCINCSICGFGNSHACKKTTILYRAILFAVGLFAIILLTKNIGDSNVEVFGKGVVAVVSAWHGHYGTCTIACQYILSYPYRYPVMGKRVYSIGTSKATGYLLHLAHAFALRAAFYIVFVFVYSLALLVCCYGVYQCVFGCQYQKVYTKNSIGSGSEYSNALFFVQCKIYRCATTLTDPVALHFLHGVAPFQVVKAAYQSVGIFCYSQKPLAHQFAFHRVAASFRYAIHYFVIGKYCSQCLAPPYLCMPLIGQSVMHQYRAFFLAAIVVPGCSIKRYAVIARARVIYISLLFQNGSKFS